MIHTNLIRTLMLTAADTAFVWSDNMGKVLTTAFLSMVPTFEGRYAVVTSIAITSPRAAATPCASTAAIPAPNPQSPPRT